MQVDREPGKIVVSDGDDGRGTFNMAIGFMQFFLAALVAVIYAAAYFFPALNEISADLLTILAIMAGVFFLIMAASLFEQRLETVFDLNRKYVEHTKSVWFWPLQVCVWRSRSAATFDQVAGLGLDERSVEGGFVYTPAITLSGKNLRLILRGGSHSAMEPALEALRLETGLVRKDHGI